MTLDTAYMITALVTMFVVIDPIAIAPVFLALTRAGLDPFCHLPQEKLQVFFAQFFLQFLRDGL